jgi:hypothetical protein
VRTTEPISSAALAEVTGDPRDQLAGCFRSWLSFSPEDRPTMKELAEQLEVLLEPDAEEVRREERRRERQKRTILYFKIAIAGMLLVGAGGAAYVYNQRETLRIAADLERARTAGAKSFDQLGTCNAAHAADTKALADCKAVQDKARDDFARQLDDVMRSGSSTQAEHAREAQRAMSRLRACDESAKEQKRSCEEETARILLETARDKTSLASQRDEAQQKLDAEKSVLAAREAERDQCRAERASCAEERDALKAAAAVRPASGRGPLPAATGVPAATGDPIAPADPKPGADPKPTAAPAPAPAPPPPPPPGAPAEPKGP